MVRRTVEFGSPSVEPSRSAASARVERLRARIGHALDGGFVSAV